MLPVAGPAFLLARWFAAALLVLFAASVAADSVGERLKNLLGPAAPGQDEILPPDAAFRLSATPLSAAAARFEWVIAEGYYLYRDQFSFAALSDDLRIDAQAIHIPRGQLKRDPYFGETEIHTGFVAIDVPLLRASAASAAGSPVQVQVGYQGCKENSICYPPLKKQLDIALPPASGSLAAAPPNNPAALSAQDRVTERLKQGSLILNIAAFFVFGLFLSLTPCVFPMIPILSGIIVGQSGSVTGRRGFLLSLAYVLAMALTYALLGALAGSFHLNLQAASQNPWTVGAFSLVFVLLALSMFGFYELRLPAALQTRLFALSQPQRGGDWRGAALMGAMSAVIVGPCVAPPLAGALLYISQTGDARLGGAALFSMGLGFGVPLLAIGASTGSLLPRAGPWLETIKRVFGLVMLGVAVWFLERVVSEAMGLLLWAAWFLSVALVLFLPRRGDRPGPWPKLSKGLGVLALVYGAALVATAGAGSDDMLRPLRYLAGQGAAPPPESARFEPVANVAELDQALARAAAQGRPAVLEFYADWCITCIEMEEDTFSDPQVKQALAQLLLLQADVTDHDEEDQRLLKRFDLFGPPAVLFFDAGQGEMKTRRLIGYVKPEPFLRHLRETLGE